MELKDEELLRRYGRGDTEALADLVGRYRKVLYAFTLRMTGNTHDADEVFQEVWMKVMQRGGDYRAGSFRSWLFRIAHNLVIDRARATRKMLSLDYEAGEGAGEGTGAGPRLLDCLEAKDPAPGTVASRRDVADAVREAVGSLAGEQREVFLMRMESGLSFKEIARIQKVSLNTALARMRYAVINLRKVLAGMDVKGELT